MTPLEMASVRLVSRFTIPKKADVKMKIIACFFALVASAYGAFFHGGHGHIHHGPGPIYKVGGPHFHDFHDHHGPHIHDFHEHHGPIAHHGHIAHSGTVTHHHTGTIKIHEEPHIHQHIHPVQLIKIHDEGFGIGGHIGAPIAAPIAAHIPAPIGGHIVGGYDHGYGHGIAHGGIIEGGFADGGLADGGFIGGYPGGNSLDSGIGEYPAHIKIIKVLHGGGHGWA